MRLCCALQQSGFYTGVLLRKAKEMKNYVEKDARGEGLHSIGQLFCTDLGCEKPHSFPCFAWRDLNLRPSRVVECYRVFWDRVIIATVPEAVPFQIDQ